MPGARGWPLSLSASSGGCASARPSTRSISPRGTPPGRSSTGVSKHPTMVDSTPIATAPPSTIRSIRPVEVALHMGGRCRRDMTRQIGRWRHHRPAERAQDGPRQRMRGNPDRDGIEPGGGKIGHVAFPGFWQHQRQRPRPERVRERDRPLVEAGDALGRAAVADVGDQRIERGPPLGLIEPRHRRRIGGIGAEAVDGLGRERHQPAVRKAARGSGHRGLVCGQNLRCQAHIHWGWRPQYGFLRCAKAKAISRVLVGVWLSPVEHCVRDAGVAGSNPATPTNKTSTCLLRAFLPCEHP